MPGLMFKAMVGVLAAVVFGCGGKDSEPPNDAVAICAAIRDEIAAMIAADGYTERIQSITDESAQMAADAGLTGADIRAECDNDVDAMLALQDEILGG